MQSILIANPKGGSGKSTLATNLAGALAHAGHRVMLGDIDRQHSAREWLGLRPAELPAISTWKFDPDAPARPPKGTTHAILDTPAGLHGKKLAAVLKVVSRVLVPLQPSPFDMRATRDFLAVLLEEKAVRHGKAYVAMVGNRVDPRTQAAQELQRFLGTYDLPVLAWLRDSQIYNHAAAAGLTIFDLPAWRADKHRADWQPILNWAAGEGAEPPSAG
ncbi:MAG: ParA family protein [Rhodocyclaceae bacterium]|nr:ParA family protein [Rhodocyclaceae bacterium]MBX3667147.1 ParA family protein [Rhodocyclaceae bacterium]